MSWYYQFARTGNYRLNVWRSVGGWLYDLWWDTKTARTTVGKGSETYDDVDEAREAAVLHLANMLPKPQSERLLATQSELVWEPWFDPRRRRSSRR
jgi:hypothetical protein